MINRKTARVPLPARERVLQFGGGNFLRAFTDWMIDRMNEHLGFDTGVVVIKPTPKGNYRELDSQEGLFHVLIQGIDKGEQVEKLQLVKSISRTIQPYESFDDYLKSAEQPEIRFVVSNTTEAGIEFREEDRFEDQPALSFPGKLCQWLFHRYQHFQGSEQAGLIFLPCELIWQNGEALRQILLRYADHWQLEPGFNSWLDSANIFCNTLVDRIVPGFPEAKAEVVFDKLGYRDALLVQAEPYHLWVIEGPVTVRKEFPADRAGLNVVFTDDLTPYHTRKVRILNGAHTSVVPVAYLYGLETVRETIEHPLLGDFVRKLIYKEILPTLDLPEEELNHYTSEVLDRFKNPFVEHRLISIALNSVSKFRTRVLPSLLQYTRRKGRLPGRMVFAFAALIRFYKGSYGDKAIPLRDEAKIISFMDGLWKDWDGTDQGLEKLTAQVLGREDIWKSDLTVVPGLSVLVAKHLIDIESVGMAVLISRFR